MIELSHEETKGAKLLLRYTLGIDVEIGRVTRDFSKSPQAEVVIDVDKRLSPERSGHVFRGRLGLLSRSGIKGCVDTCKRRHPRYISEYEKITGNDGKKEKRPITKDVPWADLIDDVCDRAMNNQRTRLAPKIVGLQEPKRERPAYQVWPLLPSRQPTIIYGQGGIGKSWLALYLYALVDHGLTKNGLNADVGNSLYVDWETDRDTLEARAWAVKRGEPEIDDGWGLRYQSAQGPLVDWIDTLAGYVEAEKFDLVVIDSVGLALGGDANGAQTVLAFFGALRQLEATTLLVDHMTKGPDSQERGAFGSVYKRNSARSVWEMRQAADGELNMGLYHRKANDSRPAPPLGLSLNIIEDDDYTIQSASFNRCDVTDDPELAKGISAPLRILAALRHGAMDLDGICEDLQDIPQATIKPALSRMVKSGKLTRPDRGMYGLVSSEKVS